MLRLAFDFIITWRETRTRPNAYITGITGKIDIIYLSFCTRPHRNHFADISKMVGHIFPPLITCYYVNAFLLLQNSHCIFAQI